jgi:hypothetical protein
MTAADRPRLSPEERALRTLSPALIADEALELKERLDTLKGELIRRQVHRVEGILGKVALSPPGEQDRTDRNLLLGTLGITEAEFVSRFTHKVRTDWRMTVTRKKTFRQAA